MSTLVEKLAEAGELTDEQVEKINQNVAEMVNAAEADPEFREKLAQGVFSGTMKYLGEKVLPIALAGGALSAGAYGYERLRESMEQKRLDEAKTVNYQNMLKSSPNLKSYDSGIVQQAFNTLHRFNPEYASDPLVASNFVARAAEDAMGDLNVVNSVVQARKNMADTRRREPLTPRAIVGFTKDVGTLSREFEGGDGGQDKPTYKSLSKKVERVKKALG
jgi:hypothetical protein